MVEPRLSAQKMIFVAVVAVVVALGVIGPLGAGWIGPREASADASTPILVEDPDPSIFTIPPGEDPEVIADDSVPLPILIVDPAAAFTTSAPSDPGSSTTTASSTSESTVTSPPAEEVSDSGVASISAEVTTTSNSAVTTTTRPVELDAQSAALVTDESNAAQGGYLFVIMGVLLVAASGALVGWRMRRDTSSC